MVWLAEEDVLRYNPIKMNNQLACTKRNFLKRLATVFDPLRFLSPYIVQAKIMMQSLWEAGLYWDTTVNRELY